MTEKQSKMWDLLCEQNAETVLNLLTDWHGLQLLDDGFYGHLVEEGYIEDPEEEPDVEDAVGASDDFEDFCSGRICWKNCPLWNIPGECEEIYDRIKAEVEW